MARSLGFGS